jgi:hypothetical protein
VGLRFAVFETAALVILQQTVLAAEVALAEAAVTNNELGSLAALGGVATDLLSSHDGRWVRRLCERVGAVGGAALPKGSRVPAGVEKAEGECVRENDDSREG